MEIVALVLAGLGLVAAIVGQIWLVVVAFQDSVGWGIGCLLCGPAALIFAIMHWEQSKKPFLLAVAGGAVAALSSLLIQQPPQ